MLTSQDQGLTFYFGFFLSDLMLLVVSSQICYYLFPNYRIPVNSLVCSRNDNLKGIFVIMFILPLISIRFNILFNHNSYEKNLLTQFARIDIKPSETKCFDFCIPRHFCISFQSSHSLFGAPGQTAISEDCEAADTT